MSDEHASVTKVPNFKGKKFCLFDSQFKAECTLNRYNDALEEKFKKDLSTRSGMVVDDMNATQKKQKETLVKNNLAIICCAFTLTMEEGLDFFRESKSATFSGGEAH